MTAFNHPTQQIKKKNNNPHRRKIEKDHWFIDLIEITVAGMLTFDFIFLFAITCLVVIVLFTPESQIHLTFSEFVKDLGFAYAGYATKSTIVSRERRQGKREQLKNRGEELNYKETLPRTVDEEIYNTEHEEIE